MRKYFGEWKSFAEIERDFSKRISLRPRDILFAAYDDDGVTGEAIVLFTSPYTDFLYLVEASHDSYYGLEDQWEPEKTNWEALSKRELINCEEEAKAAFRKLVARNLKS